MREPLKGRARDDKPAAGAGAVGRPAGRPFVREVSPAFRRVFDDAEAAEPAPTPGSVAPVAPAGAASPTPEDFR